MWNVTRKRPDLRGPLWRLVGWTLLNKPRALKHALYTAALYAHLGPFSEYVRREMRIQIDRARANPEAHWTDVYHGRAVAAAE